MGWSGEGGCGLNENFCFFLREMGRKGRILRTHATFFAFLGGGGGARRLVGVYACMLEAKYIE